MILFAAVAYAVLWVSINTLALRQAFKAWQRRDIKKLVLNILSLLILFFCLMIGVVSIQHLMYLGKL